MWDFFRRCRCVSRERELATRCARARSTCLLSSLRQTSGPLWIRWSLERTLNLTRGFLMSTHSLYHIQSSSYGRLVNCRLLREICVSLILLKVNFLTSHPTRAVTWLVAASNSNKTHFEASSCSAASADARLSHAAGHIQTELEVFLMFFSLSLFFVFLLLEKVLLRSN